MEHTVTITIIKESSTHYSVRQLLIQNMAVTKKYTADVRILYIFNVQPEYICYVRTEDFMVNTCCKILLCNWMCYGCAKSQQAILNHLLLAQSRCGRLTTKSVSVLQAN
jgi:hypothetical protein